MAERVLVTGGGGFLGRALCRALREHGHRVHSYSRQRYPDLESWGVTCHQGELTDLEQLKRAAEGCDVVFHVAAKAGVWGAYAAYHRVNVLGTQSVINTCQQLGIPRLIYTSSPSVVYSGHHEEGIDESAPYPKRYLAAYPQTKAQAERLVLAANSPRLATVALRPHLIWGPGDPHLLPRLIRQVRSGRLCQIGSGNNLVDTTYIDNAVAAHLSALMHLSPEAACAGKTYFIANGEPIPLWELIAQLLRCVGLELPRRRVSRHWAYGIACLLEMIYTLLPGDKEPPLTRFVVRQLTTAHWYDLSAARRDLGYLPQVGLQEGLRRLRLHHQSQV